MICTTRTKQSPSVWRPVGVALSTPSSLPRCDCATEEEKHTLINTGYKRCWFVGGSTLEDIKDTRLLFLIC
ncbi:unnamed protein product [Arctogadus glacialis]